MSRKSKKQSSLLNRDTVQLRDENYQIIHTIAFWGLAVLLFLPPFFRGLFFAPDQEKALFFAVLIFWLVWLYKWLKGDGRFLSHPLDCLVLAFPVVYLVSTFNAANTGLAVDEVVKTSLYFLVYWAVANIILIERDGVRIFKVICLAGVMVSLAGLATATGMIHINDGFMGGRIYSTFQYPNALASYLMTVIFISLYVWLRHDTLSLAGLLGLKEKGLPGFMKINLHRYLYILVSYMSLVVFIGTKSNGGFLVFILALVIYFIGLPGGRRVPAAFQLAIAGAPATPCAIMFLRHAVSGSSTLAWLWILAGALAAILLQALYNHLESIGLLEFISRRKAVVLLLLAGMVSAMALAGFSYINSHSQAVTEMAEQFRMRNAVERMYFYRDALKMVAERPLLGWGGGGWEEAYRTFQGYLYNSAEVHGHYLQIAVEIGITGLLVMLSIWAAFLHLTYRGLKNTGENPGRRMILWTIFTSAIALGAHAVIDFDLSLSALALVLWTMWGLMRGLDQTEVRKKTVTAATKLAKKPTPVFAVVSAFCLVFIIVTGFLITASSSSIEAGRCLKAGDHTGAVKLMEKAAFYNPFNAGYNSDLASLYTRQGKFDAAVQQAEEAISKSKYSGYRYNQLAGLYFSRNQFREAVAVAEKAVESAPYQIEWYDSLARTYFAAGYNLMQKEDKDGAKVFFAKSVQVEDRINQQISKLGPLEKSLWKVAPMIAPSAYTRLYTGASYCMLGQYQMAEPALQAVSGYSNINDETRAESLMWLSLIYQRQGKQSRSGDMLAQARTLVPDLEKQYSYIFQMLQR